MGSALPALCFREHKERGPPHCAIDRKALHVDALQISRSVELASAFGRGLPGPATHAGPFRFRIEAFRLWELRGAVFDSRAETLLISMVGFGAG
jgi:hypothetical protein